MPDIQSTVEEEFTEGGKKTQKNKTGFNVFLNAKKSRGVKGHARNEAVP